MSNYVLCIVTISEHFRFCPVLQNDASKGMADVFLSYQETGVRGGDGIVIKLAEQMRSQGFSVYIGDAALNAGQKWAAEIQLAVKRCKVFVALCSETYGDPEKSVWAYLELQLADRLKKPVVPVWHSGQFPPPAVEIFLGGAQRVPRGHRPLSDSSVDFDTAFAEVLEALRSKGVSPTFASYAKLEIWRAMLEEIPTRSAALSRPRDAAVAACCQKVGASETRSAAVTRPRKAVVAALSQEVGASETRSADVSRPRDAAVAAFCQKVGASQVDMSQITHADWAETSLNDDDCKVLAFSISIGACPSGSTKFEEKKSLFTSSCKHCGLAKNKHASGALANLTKLWLDKNQIGDTGIAELSRAIASGALANLTKVFLNTNQIGDEGIKSFSLVIASGALANLTYLGLSCNQIGDKGIKTFSSAFARGAMAGHTLHVRYLSLNNNKIGDEGIKSFSADIIASGTLDNLTILDLGHNKIGDAGIAEFSYSITNYTRRPGALAELTILFLHDNQIGDEGIKTFSTAIASGALPKLTNLYLNYNKIGSEGMKTFSPAIASGALPKLTELFYNNQIGDAGICKFSHAIASLALALSCQRRGIKIS